MSAMAKLLPLLSLVQGSLHPITLPDQPHKVISRQDKTSRVWFTANDELPHIQNNFGLYRSDKPDIYSLVNHLNGGYIVAAPLAPANIPNTFVLLNKDSTGYISAWDAEANKTYWEKEIRFDDSYWQPDTPVIFSTADGSLVMFVAYNGPRSTVTFLDGRTGEEVKISGADVSTANDLGYFEVHPMGKSHLVIFYGEIFSSLTRVVDGEKKQVVHSTSYFDGYYKFVPPSSLWQFNNNDHKSQAYFIDLAANKTSRVSAMDKIVPTAFSYTSTKTLAVATGDGDITVKRFDLEKLMFLDSLWTARGNLIHLEEYGQLVVYNQGSKYFVSNFATNKTWDLFNDQQCASCDTGYIVQKSPIAPKIIVLDHCECKLTKQWNTLVYRFQV